MKRPWCSLDISPIPKGSGAFYGFKDTPPPRHFCVPCQHTSHTLNRPGVGRSTPKFMQCATLCGYDSLSYSDWLHAISSGGKITLGGTHASFLIRRLLPACHVGMASCPARHISRQLRAPRHTA